MIRLLNTTARLAYGHPYIVRLILASMILIPICLATIGVVALISNPAPWKFLLFAAAWLAAFVWISDRRS
jgi:hypothetical protein